jgi:hypothetical protein
MLIGKVVSKKARDAFYWWKNNLEKYYLAVDLHESGRIRIE